MDDSSGWTMIVISGNWPYAVCVEGVQSTADKCTVCKKWMHKRYSGVRCNMSLVIDCFMCKRWDGTIQEADLAEDLVMDGETYILVKSFCISGGTNIAATVRIRNGGYISKSFFHVYASCVRRGMIYASETMLLLADVGLKFERAEMQIIDGYVVFS